MILDADIDHILCFLQGDAAALFGVESIDGEAAEIAFGIADVRDGKLEVTGPAVVKDLANQARDALAGPDDGRGKIRRGLRVVLNFRWRVLAYSNHAPKLIVPPESVFWQCFLLAARGHSCPMPLGF